MATDANAPKDLEQRSVCGTVGAGEVDILNVEPTAEDKENNNVHAAAQTPRMLFRRYRLARECCKPRHTPCPSLDNMATLSQLVNPCVAGACRLAAAEGQRHVP